MFGCCGPIFLLSWPFFLHAASGPYFLVDVFFLVDVISVDFFPTLDVFLCGPIFRGLFFEYGLVYSYLASGSTVNIHALNISKAFDKINHQELFIKLMERGLSNKLLALLEDWWIIIGVMCVKWGNSAILRFWAIVWHSSRWYFLTLPICS